MKNNRLFICYSLPLRNFLSSNNIQYELVGLNPNTLKMFWVYIKEENLIKLLEEWSK